MKSFVLITFFAIIALAYSRPEEKYTTKYDNVDLDEILRSDRLLEHYFVCLKGGRCNPDGEELRNALPGALKEDCAKCSDKQKEASRKVIEFLVEHKPEMFKELESIYDKDGVYRKKYQAEFEKKGIKL